ncbi:MAG: EVE domain-containing protein [Kofleriaceae bacterium]
MTRHWLMKSEPDTFGIADLERVRVEPWTGVRSFFARAHMRAMSVGDAVLFHHSNTAPPGVAGLARVVRTGVIDETQFDPASKYYDPKATRERPIWDCVEVEYVETLPYYVSMDRMRSVPMLADMMVLRRGMRLSVQPVTELEYATVAELGHIDPGPEPPKPRKPPRPRKPPNRPGRPAVTRTARTAPAPRTSAKARTPATARKRSKRR